GRRLTSGLLAIGSGGALTNATAGGVVAGGLTNAGLVYFSTDTTITGPVYNQGTFLAVRPAVGTPDIVLSNQLVNVGSLIVSNASDNANNSLAFVVAGVSGTAVTNDAGGWMLFFAAESHESISNARSNGSVVN